MTFACMRGKRGLIMGVANEKSIAWAIAQACAAAGARMTFSYQNDVLAGRVRPLVESLGALEGEHTLLPCDASDADSLDALFAQLAQDPQPLDFVLHAVAFSHKNELRGRYLETSAANFTETLAVSCYSFTAVARRAEPLMRNGGALLTLTYYGAEKVMPNYNVMGVAKAALEASVRYLAADLGPGGIRVNALSAGPIRTLAAAGINDFRGILKWNELNAPLRRTITPEDAARSGLYLLSDMSSGVTGEVHHVDCGYHVVGMRREEPVEL